MTSTTERVLGVVADVSVVITIGVSSILIRQLATPFQRGFFRDDESLMYPYKEASTIPVLLLYGVGFTLPSLVILLIEAGWIKQRKKKEGPFTSSLSAVVREWLWKSYKVGLMFFFGVVVTHFSTNVPKYSIGRLRPHFFAVCAPDLSKVSSGYIQDAVCTGDDADRIKEARVSFPSGHSSMAVYCMLFLVLYLQVRFTWRGMHLLRPLLQVLCTMMAFYTCLSRVSDYKHHWSDVLAGGLLGAVVAGFVFWSLHKSCLRGLVLRDSEQRQLVSSADTASLTSRPTSQSTTETTAM